MNEDADIEAEQDYEDLCCADLMYDIAFPLKEATVAK